MRKLLTILNAIARDQQPWKHACNTVALPLSRAREGHAQREVRGLCGFVERVSTQKATAPARSSRGAKDLQYAAVGDTRPRRCRLPAGSRLVRGADRRTGRPSSRRRDAARSQRWAVGWASCL